MCWVKLTGSLEWILEVCTQRMRRRRGGVCEGMHNIYVGVGGVKTESEGLDLVQGECSIQFGIQQMIVAI